MLHKIGLGLLAIFGLIQFIRPDYDNPPADPTADYLAQTTPPSEVGQLIKASCYDCHSHHTRYPWYAQVAPASWWIAHHVEEAREHLNFSTWTAYDAEKKAHKLEECAEEVREKHMPLRSYPPLHPEARLSDEQRERLAAWFEQPMGGEIGQVIVNSPEEGTYAKRK
jgi:uncharacterized membrane protein